MRFIADFHIHSKYSRATSKNADLESFSEAAVQKGIMVLGTGDFTHPQWFMEIKEKLEPAEDGFFRLKKLKKETRFILSAEISCIYNKKGAIRKIHIILIVPSIKTVEKINTQLGWIGNLKSDGRPILGLDVKDLLKIVLDASPESLFIPAHAWTPWFSIFGSKSGFDSIEECFEELSPYVYAIETGLSSDPPMNWRISKLDKITLISNSDAHSPPKLGREANVFDCELNYKEIFEAIKNKDKNKFLYTIEFFPEEGKYHFDGHRLCNIRLSPEESKKYNNVCPKCGKILTLGVLNRVSKLSDRESGFVPENAIPYKRLIPLEEIIAETIGQSTGTKEVLKEYQNLIDKIGSEFAVLIDASEKDLNEATLPEIANNIIKMRNGELYIEPGYDGVFGKIKIFKDSEKNQNVFQKTLF